MFFLLVAVSLEFEQELLSSYRFCLLPLSPVAANWPKGGHVTQTGPEISIQALIRSPALVS